MRLYHLLRFSLLANFGFADMLTATRPLAHTDPTITAAPESPGDHLSRRAETPKSTDIHHLGWTWDDGKKKYVRHNCSDNAYYDTNSNHQWQCCEDGAAVCPYIDSCARGIVTYQSSSTAVTAPCDEVYAGRTSATGCYTVLMSQSYTGGDVWTQLMCGNSEGLFTYYRDEPPISTSSISTTSSALPPSSLTDISIPNPTGSPPVEPPPTPSKVWIAGAVVGPIVGLALIGAIVFFCLRHRKKKAALLHSPPMQHNPPLQNAALSYPVNPGPAPAYSSPQQPYSAIHYGGESSGATSPFQTQDQKQQWAQHAEQTHELLSPSPPTSPGPSPQQQLAYSLNQGGGASGAEARTFSVELEDGGPRR